MVGAEAGITPRYLALAPSATGYTIRALSTRPKDDPICPPPDHAGPRSVGMALLFWPRGGSAQVARYLGQALQARGTQV